MTVISRYVVYELNKVMGSDKHLALEEVFSPGWKSSFTTEEEAIEHIIKMDRKYEDFLILKKICVID